MTPVAAFPSRQDFSHRCCTCLNPRVSLRNQENAMTVMTSPEVVVARFSMGSRFPRCSCYDFRVGLYYSRFNLRGVHAHDTRNTRPRHSSLYSATFDSPFFTDQVPFSTLPSPLFPPLSTLLQSTLHAPFKALHSTLRHAPVYHFPLHFPVHSPLSTPQSTSTSLYTPPSTHSTRHSTFHSTSTFIFHPTHEDPKVTTAMVDMQRRRMTRRSQGDDDEDGDPDGVQPRGSTETLANAHGRLLPQPLCFLVTPWTLRPQHLKRELFYRAFGNKGSGCRIYIGFTACRLQRSMFTGYRVQRS